MTGLPPGLLERNELGGEAGRRLGIRSATINFWLKKRGHPSFENLLRIHEVTGVNLSWLILGPNSGYEAYEGAPAGRVSWPLTPYGSIKSLASRRPKGRPSATMRTPPSKTRGGPVTRS
jgi:transcriptional regulator with XRE-family HTH domain